MDLIVKTTLLVWGLFFLSCSADHEMSEKKEYEIVFRLVDTDFSKGRLGFEQEINLNDLVRFHGHLCDGLVLGAMAFEYGAQDLFPNGVIDRTNLRIKSNSSPCLTDVAAYLSGGRYQFNTFYVDNDMGSLFEMQRLDNHKSVAIRIKQGVKPQEIDELGAQAVTGSLSPCGIDSLRQLEDEFTTFLLKSKPSDLFKRVQLDSLHWNSPLDQIYLKTDILNKNKEVCN